MHQLNLRFPFLSQTPSVDSGGRLNLMVLSFPILCPYYIVSTITEFHPCATTFLIMAPLFNFYFLFKEYSALRGQMTTNTLTPNDGVVAFLKSPDGNWGMRIPPSTFGEEAPGWPGLVLNFWLSIHSLELKPERIALARASVSLAPLPIAGPTRADSRPSLQAAARQLSILFQGQYIAGDDPGAVCPVLGFHRSSLTACPFSASTSLNFSPIPPKGPRRPWHFQYSLCRPPPAVPRSLSFLPFAVQFRRWVASLSLVSETGAGRGCRFRA